MAVETRTVASLDEEHASQQSLGRFARSKVTIHYLRSVFVDVISRPFQYIIERWEQNKERLPEPYTISDFLVSP